jgi:hypothetical protein
MSPNQHVFGRNPRIPSDLLQEEVNPVPVSAPLFDEATAKTLQTLNSSSVWGNNVTVTVKQTSAAVSATNPMYTMTCLVNNTTPINGAVGDISTQSVTWNVSGVIVVTSA